MENQIYDLYGMKYKAVIDDKDGCNKCDLCGRCELEDIDICRRENIGKNKHFERIDLESAI